MGSGLEVEQGRYHAVTRCHGLGNRVRQRPGVGRGIAYGVPADEIDRWSPERRAQYRRNGSQITNPSN